MIKAGECYVKFIDVIKTRPTVFLMGTYLKLHYTSYAMKVIFLLDYWDLIKLLGNYNQTCLSPIKVGPSATKNLSSFHSSVFSFP